VQDFLGKYLIHETDRGRISGLITDVEAYPAFVDEVSHGNKRTKRTEVMYGPGGYAYIYLIYGMYYQFAIVVNKPEIPEVVFIRGVKPEKGVELMRENFGREVDDDMIMTRTPGNLCKSFGITTDLYGEYLVGDRLFLEDRGFKFDPSKVKSDTRIGISERLKGSDRKLRFYLEL
jgi:DNA-3-methyladenine glycosylase